jgi:hypothetical protein
MSDTSNNGDEIYEDGGVPADADLNPEAGEVTQSLPGGSKLDEGEEDGLSEEEVRPHGTALP